MKNTLLLSSVAVLTLSLAFTGEAQIQPISHVASASLTSAFDASANASHKSYFTIPGVNPTALKLGLNAYYHLQSEGKVHDHYLTIVDFTKPSSASDRLSVIDVDNKKLVMQTLVAHGKGSGDLYATHFSNAAGTNASSLGAYVTRNSFIGEHGQSLALQGVEPGINDHANSRAIEIHPASYVSTSFVHQVGRLGRSWGCFAVNPQVSKQLINKIKDGSVLFAYAPQENHDPFVTSA